MLYKNIEILENIHSGDERMPPRPSFPSEERRFPGWQAGGREDVRILMGQTDDRPEIVVHAEAAPLGVSRRLHENGMSS